MNDELCPKCGGSFPASKAWAPRSKVLGLLSPALSDLDTRVLCPTCKHVFPAAEYRFFGFLSPSAMRAFVLCFVIAMLGYAGYVLVAY